eukprot:CAMPEP_0203685048 /NCGR_PEP_ID=MMETSP0090-20130426/48343_1 /ASSEMBLY_ACC=CAM_ASM_001088 /TAXON_ID=426623 /ORGANISM="Chaetoceros affinis, Strain CCMP159" /LENGTH=1117 /DNA_ID=CAMNT_0050554233 /DNA_START=181 /DNA_END=3534 /DNA_ORIENTATION=+
MALMACIGIAMRRDAGRTTTAAAFAFATKGNMSTSTSTFTSTTSAFSFKRPSFSTSSSPSSPSSFSILSRDISSSSSTCSASSITSSSLKSTVAPEDIEKVAVVEHPSYDIIKKELVEEYGAHCTMYRHKKTGAELLSVHNDDDNKVFGITFRTPPSDSTGVPHILEHSVLCGSKKYTSKEPFVQLLQGSLQTFLNAFTYPDRTCYVIASQNDKDFKNLINVYADAVFNPRATNDPMVHAQEGWHLELEDKEDPLTYKGVVYNEMKGVYSSPDSLLMRESQRSIFPDNTYSVDSGGDPVAIPELSFEQFADFHAKFYHPANSRIYFWGDDDVEERLNLMDEYLSDFGPSPESKPASQIEWQKKTITEPAWEQHPYPIGEDQPETNMVMVNWLMNEEPLTPTEDLIVGVMDHLLMGTSQSFLYKKLMESGLGAAITGGGLSDELLQATFSVGLKGVQAENSKAVEELVLNTLAEAAEEGFSDEEIASAMNTIEFRLREFNTGSFPKGLSFMLGAMSKWIYDREPTDALKFEEPLAELKSKIAESGSEVFKSYIKDYLVKNKHRITIEMVPSKTLEAQQLKDEEDRLKAIKDSLSEEEIDDIIAKTKELKKLQAAEDAPEDRATIPSLELSDLKREVTEYPIAEVESDSGVTVLNSELASTSGIAYVKFGVDISGVDYDDLALLPVFIRTMTETGAGDLSDVALSQKIGTHTGGLSVSMMTRPVRSEGIADGAVLDGSNLLTKLIITGKATSTKTDELFSIFKLILTDANLDSQKKVVEMLKETKTRIESSIQGSGHSYSNTRMKARYSVPGFLNEKMGGISYLKSVNQLLKDAEEDWDSVLTRLKNIRKAILNESTCRDGMMLHITGDKAVLETVQPSVDEFLSSLPGDANGSKLPDFYNIEHPWATRAKADMPNLAPLKDEGFVVPTQVSYVGKGGQLYEQGEIVPGTGNVVSRFLRTGYLWDHVRVIGGAYGGFCTFDAKGGDGVFTYLSYRDPNLDKTLDVYDATSDALLEAAEELEKNPDALATAIIGAVGDMDGALSPDQKGATALNRWISRETPERRQQFRDEVLNTKASDFKDFAMRLKDMKKQSVAVVSSKAAFDAAAKAGKEMELNQVV